MSTLLFKSLLLLLAIPVAHYLYPPAYEITLSKEELEAEAKPYYSTHTSLAAETLHFFNEHFILLPAKTFLRCQAYTIQPCPGEGKDLSKWQMNLKKAAAFTGMVLASGSSIGSVTVGGLLRAIEHRFRPFISYLHTPHATIEKIALQKERALHLCAFNVGLTPTSLNIKMDLRPPVERAHEIAQSLLHDTKRPDILIIEEGWHEEALKALCHTLSSLYPHILHNAAPSILGLSSGIAVFSMYEIEEIKFLAFDKMIGQHQIPPRGVLRVALETEKGPLYIYGGIHFQAMDGKCYSQARKYQLGQLKQLMDQEAKSTPGIYQIAMGDLNISLIDTYGHDNRDQAEGEVLQAFDRDFQDLFLKDHDRIEGKRLTGVRYFQDEFPEASASWYDGPFTREPEKTEALKHLALDREKHGYPDPRILGVCEKPVWGTDLWYNTQPAKNARYDYIFVPKESPLDGHVEIRRIPMKAGSQSPASDHLQLHGFIWLN